MFFHIAVTYQPNSDGYEKILNGIIYMHFFKVESFFDYCVYFGYAHSFSFLLLYILFSVICNTLVISATKNTCSYKRGDVIHKQLIRSEKVFLANYGLHCPVFGNSVGVLVISCSECDSILKLKIFENTFC